MKIIACILVIISAHWSFASAPKVGRTAAAKYFQSKGVDSEYPSGSGRGPSSTIETLSSGDHYLALGFGTFTQTSAYNWGNGTKQEDVGKWGIDMTYRLTQDYALFDEAIRISYNEYEPVGKRTSKMSFLYALTFPDAGSQFPLYFGIAAGPGIFFKQVEDESSLALDYQLLLGLRLFNLFEKTGFYVEGGLRNHLQLTSDGQVNGTFISAGAVFTF